MEHPYVLTDADLEHSPWEWDDTHCPEPASPLFQTLHPVEVASGVAGPRLRWRHGYLYCSDAGGLLVRPGPELKSRWEQHWFPQVKYDLDQMLDRNRDLTQATTADLLAEIDRRIAVRGRHWDWYYEVSRGSRAFLTGVFAAAYRRYVRADGTDLAPFQLLQGIDSMVAVTNGDLSRLANLFKASPTALASLRLAAPSQLVSTLRRTGRQAKRVAEALEVFLDKHGLQFAGTVDHATPPWREDLQFVVAVLRAYVDRDYDHEAERQRLDDRRREAEFRTLTAIPAWREREEFKDTLAIARGLAPLCLDAYHWICLHGTSCTRHLYLTIGERLARDGVIEHPSHVFYLWLDEVRENLRRPRNLRLQVYERRDEHMRQQAVPPAPILDAVAAAGKDVVGNNAAGPAATVAGQPAAPGCASGRSRVITRLRDLDRMRPGEVLVCRTATPPWSALFSTAAAVVADAGHAFSLVAHLARDYAVPAVLGAGDATGCIRSGEVVTVDGAAGTIRRHGAAQPAGAAW